MSSEQVERALQDVEAALLPYRRGTSSFAPPYLETLCDHIEALVVALQQQAEEIERLRPENVDARGDYWRALAEQQGREIEAKQKALRQITRCHSCSRAKELARAALSTQPKEQGG